MLKIVPVLAELFISISAMWLLTFLSTFRTSLATLWAICCRREIGNVIEQLTEKISYDSNIPMDSELHYQVGEREIELVQIGGDERTPHYMPTENGAPLLPERSWVSDYSYERSEGIISFDVYRGNEPQDESEMLILFADGKIILEPRYSNYSGGIGHTLLYVNFNSSENYGSNGNGIWCYDTDTGERWQLKIDSECELYSFTNDNQMLS